MARTPLPPVPDVLKAVIEGVTSFARNWNTVFHFLYTGTPPNAADLALFASDILGAFQTFFLPLTPPTTTVKQSMITDLSTIMMPTSVFTDEHPGTSTADKLPANCATLFNYTVDMRYQGGHPRNYVYCGTDENLLNESQWNPAYVTSANAAMLGFLTEIVGDVQGGTTIVDPVMVSYYQGKDPITGKPARRTDPLVLREVMLGCNQLVGSQRRRIGRRS